MTMVIALEDDAQFDRQQSWPRHCSSVYTMEILSLPLRNGFVQQNPKTPKPQNPEQFYVLISELKQKVLI